MTQTSSGCTWRACFKRTSKAQVSVISSLFIGESQMFSVRIMMTADKQRPFTQAQTALFSVVQRRRVCPAVWPRARHCRESSYRYVGCCLGRSSLPYTDGRYDVLTAIT